MLETATSLARCTKEDIEAAHRACKKLNAYYEARGENIYAYVGPGGQIVSELSKADARPKKRVRLDTIKITERPLALQIQDYLTKNQDVWTRALHIREALGSTRTTTQRALNALVSAGIVTARQDTLGNGTIRYKIKKGASE